MSDVEEVEVKQPKSRKAPKKPVEPSPEDVQKAIKVIEKKRRGRKPVIVDPKSESEDDVVAGSGDSDNESIDLVAVEKVRSKPGPKPKEKPKRKLNSKLAMWNEFVKTKGYMVKGGASKKIPRKGTDEHKELTEAFHEWVGAKLEAEKNVSEEH